MIFYFSGSGIFKTELFEDVPVKNALFSYIYTKSKQEPLLDFYDNVFIDSGGYSARVGGIDIDPRKYGEWLLNHPKLKVYANLDMPTTEETVANQKLLEEMGLHPLPVFHYDEFAEGKIDLLKHYVDNYKYIALGGIAGVNVSQDLFQHYLDFVFSMTRDKVRVHGFAMTGLEMMKRYPFYSVDSTSWLAGGRYGRVAKKTGLLDKAVKVHDPSKYYLSRTMTSKEMFKAGLDVFLQVEKDITALWKSRGVDWEEIDRQTNWNKVS